MEFFGIKQLLLRTIPINVSHVQQQQQKLAGISKISLSVRLIKYFIKTAKLAVQCCHRNETGTTIVFRVIPRIAWGEE